VISKNVTIAGAGSGETLIDGSVSFGYKPAYLNVCFPGGGVLTGVTVQRVTKACKGDLSLEGSHVLDGVRVIGGSGVYSTGTASIAITRTTIDGIESRALYASGRGRICCGGFYSYGSGAYVAVSESQIRARAGAAVYGRGQTGIVLENSTVSGPDGVSMYPGWVVVKDSTIVGETSRGLAARQARRRPRVELENSIIVGATDDCALESIFGVSSRGHNLFNQDGCRGVGSTDLRYTDPLLLPVADNGGFTNTFALAPGSPAIDAAGDDCLPTDQRGVMRPQDGDGDGVAKCDIGAYEFDVRQVAIDIKPQSIPNAINPYSRGVIPVAILGSDTFDVSDIDVTTLTFGSGGAAPAHNLADSFTYNDHLQDVNLDGYMDLMTHYRTRETGIFCGDESATLTGETLDGQPIEGSDSINTVGCRAPRWPGIWRNEEEREAQTREGAVIDLKRKR
jgi:hypothetical protein